MLHLCNIALQIETVYQVLQRAFTHIHFKDHTLTNEDTQRLFEELADLGITQEEAVQFFEFMRSIRPTFGQILKNHTQQSTQSEQTNKMIERRNRIIRRIGKPRFPFILDTYKDPADRSIHYTWPVHSSAAYLFEEILIYKEQPYIRKLSLLPSIVATAGAPEKILGVELVRS